MEINRSDGVLDHIRKNVYILIIYLESIGDKNEKVR